MFYEPPERMQDALRFGDVLQGFAVCTPVINNPPLSDNYDYQLAISMLPYYVVLSPCCSIRDQILSVAPLIPIKQTLFSNPYLVEDPTRINVLIEPIHSIPPLQWERMNDAKRASHLSRKPHYIFYENFVYKENDLFRSYIVNRREGNITVRHYMIDFRHTYRIEIKTLQSPEASPLKCKCLQLTDEVRGHLRDKITFYFARIPAEEIAQSI